MGPSPSTSSIKYVQTVNDEHFGKIQIFQALQNPAQYIMKYRRIHSSKQQLVLSLKFHQNFEKLKHRVLVKLHFLQSASYQTCIEVFELNSYYSYYNITLEQIFMKRATNQSTFPENQLWYILQSLIEVGEYLQGQQLALQNYSIKKIFVTPGGFLKVYLAEVEENNHHSNYYKVLKWIEQSHQILSPEQLVSLANKNININYNTYKSDIFSIGIIMLQLMSLNDGGFYNYNQNSIDLNKIRYMISEQIINKTYSKTLINYIKLLLEVDQKKRFDFKEASLELKNLKANHKIDMVKSVGADISVKRKSQTIIPPLVQSNYISKLVAGPINSMVFKKRSTVSMISRNTEINKQN